MPQYTVSADESDGSAFTLPDAGGFEVDNADASSLYHWYIHIDNGFDVGVDVTVQGTHAQDPGMASPVSDGATETIAAGETSAFDGKTPHSYLRVEATPSGDPLAGELVVTFQKRRV